MEILIVYNSEGKILYGTTVNEFTKAGIQEAITAEGNFSLVHDSMPQAGDKVVNGKVVQEAIEAPTVPTLDRLREVRTRLLEECDWTQFPDSPLSDSKKAEWATYRTQLRNLPSNYTNSDDITDVTWPTKPS